MKRNTLTLGATALALALAFPLTSLAGAPADCPKGGPGGPYHGGPGPFSADRLPPYLDGINLTEAQRTAIKDILKTKGEALRSKWQDRRDNFEELRKLAFSADYTAEKAKALVEAGMADKTEVALLHAELDNAIFKVLTAEQQQQVKNKPMGFHGRRWKKD